MNSFDPKQLSFVRKLQAERNRLAELVQQKVRHADVLERQLRRVLDGMGVVSETLDITELIDPLDRGTNLRTGWLGVEVPAGRADPIAPQPTSWWPRRPAERPALLPNVGWINHAIQGRTRHTIGFSVVGMARAALAEALDIVCRQQAEATFFAPVFLYDGEDFDLFRAHGYVFEWLPPAREMATYDGHVDWRSYVMARIELIRRKWHLVEIVHLTPLAWGETPSVSVLALHDMRPSERARAAA